MPRARRPRIRLTRRGLWLACGLLAAAPGAAPACDDLKDRDRQPPYTGPGHRGSRLPPDARGQVLGMSAANVNLLSWLPFHEFPGVIARGSDIWGYVSPSGREYAIMGFDAGTGFVDLSDPTEPVVVGFVPSVGTLWKEITTYGEYAYIVSDQVGNGMQVVDLRAIDRGSVTLARTVTTGGLATVHTIRVNPESGWIYLNGSNLGSGGLLPYDVRDPANPVPGPMIWSESYVHDAVIVTLHAGPQAGREIAYCCCGYDGFKIVDVTDKANLRTLSRSVYPNLAYCHYAWLSDDRRTIFVGDEFDELAGSVRTSTTYVLNVGDPATPVYETAFTNGNPAIDHNPVGRGRWLFEANYRSGLRVYDTAHLEAVREVGHFDTYPDDDAPNFNGTWGVHRLPSGVVICSDMERGLFAFDVTPATGADIGDPGAYGPAGLLRIAPNPFRADARLTFVLPEAGPARLRIVDPAGREVEVLADGRFGAGHHVRPWNPRDLASGAYFAVLTTPRGTESRRLIHVR